MVFIKVAQNRYPEILSEASVTRPRALKHEPHLSPNNSLGLPLLTHYLEQELYSSKHSA